MRRNQHIDFIKGLCILSVILQHYAWAPGTEMRWRFSFWLSTAVPVFMMISGYVYAQSFRRRGVVSMAEGYDGKDLVRRLLRYLLPYSFFFLVEQVLLYLTGSLPRIGPFILLKSYLHGGPLLYGSYYVPLLMQLVFLFPPIYLLIRRRGFRGLVICGLVNFAYELLHWAYSMGPDLYGVLILRYLLLIAFGCYLALYPGTLSLRCHALSFLAGLSWMVLVEFVGYYPRIVTDWSVSSVLAAFYIMPFFALAVERGKAHFAPVDLLGRASYNILLAQVLYYIFFADRLYALIPQPALQVAANLLICCVCGVVFYRIEDPTTRKLQRLVLSWMDRWAARRKS